MKCHEKCTPPEWTEHWPKAEWPDGPPLTRNGQPMHGTGKVKLKPGTGCFYTQEGTGCCLLPTSGAVQPDDLTNPKIAAKRLELLEQARAEGEMKEPDGDLKKATADRKETW